MKENDHIKTLRAAKAAATTLTETAAALSAQHETLLTERRSVVEASGSLDEVLVNMRRLVDEASVRLSDRVALTLVRTVSGYTEQRHGGTADQRIVHPHLPPNRYGALPDSLGLEDLCALAPELMKSQLERVIRASGARFGLPSAERVTKLAELDAQIADIETQHTELIDGAADVGIVLPLLDSVKERRETIARREARDRELAAERAAGVFTVGR